MSELKWTKERPTIGGYYWLLPAVGHGALMARVYCYRPREEGMPDICRIDEADAIRIPLFSTVKRMSDDLPDGEYRFWGDVSNIDGVWAGPIPGCPAFENGAAEFTEAIQHLRDSGANSCSFCMEQHHEMELSQ